MTNQEIFDLMDRFERSKTVQGHLRLHTEQCKHFSGDLTVELVIFRQQNVLFFEKESFRKDRSVLF